MLHDQNNELPFGKDAQEKIVQRIEQRRIDPRSGLVKQKQVRSRDDAGNDFQQPPLAERQISGGLGREAPQIDEIEEALGFLATGLTGAGAAARCL